GGTGSAASAPPYCSSSAAANSHWSGYRIRNGFPWFRRAPHGLPAPRLLARGAGLSAHPGQICEQCHTFRLVFQRGGDERWRGQCPAVDVGAVVAGRQPGGAGVGLAEIEAAVASV